MSYYLGAGGVQSSLAVHDEDTGILYRPTANWNYRHRGPQGISRGYHDTWGDPEDANMAGFGSPGLLATKSWAPWTDAVGGMTRPYFIIGQTLDANSLPIAATVQGFTTTGDIYVGEIGSDDAGYYSLPTLYTSEAHYLVAYRNGSPATAGTTVNTLMPGLSPS